VCPNASLLLLYTISCHECIEQ